MNSCVSGREVESCKQANKDDLSPHTVTGIPSTTLPVLLKSLYPSLLPCKIAEISLKERHTENTSAHLTAIKTTAKLTREVNT